MHRFRSIPGTTFLLLLAASLAACHKSAPDLRPAPAPVTSDAIELPAPTAQPLPQTVWRSTDIDGYKVRVAEQILAANPGTIFDGRLPPMLPAIVVVNISVDEDGKLARVVVQRSRDSEASEVALASIRRSGPFPRPFTLMAKGSRTLDFSETFLFNRDYRFQLRTLAGPQ